MAVYSKFMLNTDYTSIKEKVSFDYTLNVSDTILQAYDSATRYIDITVPEGTYFENVNITLSIIPDESSPTPFMVYVKELGDYEIYQIVTSLVRISSTTYRLYAYISNFSSSTRTIPAFFVNVKAHLFVSAF